MRGGKVEAVMGNEGRGDSGSEGRGKRVNLWGGGSRKKGK